MASSTGLIALYVTLIEFACYFLPSENLTEETMPLLKNRNYSIFRYYTNHSTKFGQFVKYHAARILIYVGMGDRVGSCVSLFHFPGVHFCRYVFCPFSVFLHALLFRHNTHYWERFSRCAFHLNDVTRYSHLTSCKVPRWKLYTHGGLNKFSDHSAISEAFITCFVLHFSLLI